jgi:hypothetical protein
MYWGTLRPGAIKGQRVLTIFDVLPPLSGGSTFQVHRREKKKQDLVVWQPAVGCMLGGRGSEFPVEEGVPGSILLPLACPCAGILDGLEGRPLPEAETAMRIALVKILGSLIVGIRYLQCVGCAPQKRGNKDSHDFVSGSPYPWPCCLLNKAVVHIRCYVTYLFVCCVALRLCWFTVCAVDVLLMLCPPGTLSFRKELGHVVVNQRTSLSAGLVSRQQHQQQSWQLRHASFFHLHVALAEPSPREHTSKYLKHKFSIHPGPRR